VQPNKGKPGRHKEIETPDWKAVSILLPEEVYRALRRYCYEKDTKQAAVIRELLEKLLESKGLLKITVEKDAEGREIRGYKVVE
jgi:predicted DNA-binding protein